MIATVATGAAPRAVTIVGGGPAGLAAALEIVRYGSRATIVEALDQVGGLARTIERRGNRFDIGPHRFFTLNSEVLALFIEICGTDLIRVSRLTRIFHGGRFFDYPLTPVNALFGVGLSASVAMAASYLAARLRRLLVPRPIATFEDWVVDRFGDRLFRTFFKSYTEKVWGIDCQRIAADWAGERIKGLSLAAAISDALFKLRHRPRTLADEFLYPRLGAGQLYEKMAERIAAGGGTIRLGSACRTVRRQGFRITGVEVRRPDGTTEAVGGDYFLVSAPLTELLAQLDPPPPSDVKEAAAGLRYRHHVGVQLTLAGRPPFPDNWIYIHEPALRMARVSSYRNFSAAMSHAGDRHPLTVEYFCFTEDAIWTAPETELVALATRELAAAGLADPSAVVDGFVVRSPRAYPVIEIGVGERLRVIKDWLDRFENLLPIGRSGMFKYNNQDHAMATGILAARTALGLGRFDPWRVNIDGIYQEGGPAPSGPGGSRRRSS